MSSNEAITEILTHGLGLLNALKQADQKETPEKEEPKPTVTFTKDTPKFEHQMEYLVYLQELTLRAMVGNRYQVDIKAKKKELGL